MSLADASLRQIGDPLEVYVALGKMLERPAWQADALCREYPDINFFPERGEATEPAKSICASCIVRADCLQFALEHRDVGVWGATSAAERIRLGRALSSSAHTPWVAAGARTACVNGHPFDDDNTRLRVTGDGRTNRVCKACEADRRRKRSAA